MAWNAGTFTRVSTSVSPAVGNTTIESSGMNTYTADVTAGINQCLNKDGSNAATGNLNAGSNKITALADGTAATDAATVGQLDDVGGANINSSDEFDFITSTATSITASTYTAVPFDGANYATANEFGMYQINANIGIDSVDDGSYVSLALYVDPLGVGSPAVRKIGPMVYNNTGGAAGLRVGMSAMIDLDPTDRVYVYAYHSSATAKTLTANNTLNWFNGFRVIGTSG